MAKLIIRGILFPCIIITVLFPYVIMGNFSILEPDIKEEKRMDSLVGVVTLNLKTNGWKNIIIFGHFPDLFYNKLKFIPLTFTTSSTDNDDYYIENSVPYPSNMILMNCPNFVNFEKSLLQVMSLPYWHPHSNILLYYPFRENNEKIAKIFYIFWYYKVSNIIIIQYDDNEEVLLLTQFSPFVSNTYELDYKYGCWTVRSIAMPIITFEKSFACEENCNNVTGNSRLRSNNLGTCIGFVTHKINYSDRNSTSRLNLFEDKGKNFHGFPFKAFLAEVLPFQTIEINKNNTYTMGNREGNVWNTLAILMNFTLDLTVNVKNKQFHFLNNIKQLFTVAQRKADLFLLPIYQFDVGVVEIDYTFPYKESGVCFMAHRAGFETILFDLKTLVENYEIMLQFLISFVCIWFVFCLYSGLEANKLDMDLVGKNLMNSFRSVLLISLSNPPKRTSFRIFLAITIWSFFIVNFSSQAAITSFFTAFKRGREVDTFEDIAEKGYLIQGLATPDAILPDTKEAFRKINSKLQPIMDIYSCATALSNDIHRFCTIDCAVGRYLEKNMLNENGEQYLHITKDRIHSYSINIIFSKHSVFTDTYNRHILSIFEAGLIKKWEEYKFNDIKEDAPTKPLSMGDLMGIFDLFGVFLIITIVVFVIEVVFGKYTKIKTII